MIAKINVIETHDKVNYTLRTIESRGRYTTIITDKVSNAQFKGNGTLSEESRGNAYNAYRNALPWRA